jgi:hypothetical protein
MTSVTTVAPGRGPYEKDIEVLAMSSAAVSVSATTNEETLATYNLPAYKMGPNDLLRITSHWSWTGSTNSKTWRHRFGALAAQDNGTTSAGITSLRATTEIKNINSRAVQKSNSFSLTIAGSLPATAVGSGTVNTTAGVAITITGQKGSSGETMTLESYTIELVKAP